MCVCVFKCLENYFSFVFAAIRLVKCRKRDLVTQRICDLKLLYLITFECNYGGL